jgi:hypothetical protein
MIRKKKLLVKSASCEKEERVGEAKVISAKIEDMCFHIETDKYDRTKWQTLLAYTATDALTETSPLPLLCSDFDFPRNRGE